jgi:hypothetical protein
MHRYTYMNIANITRVLPADMLYRVDLGGLLYASLYIHEYS